MSFKICAICVFVNLCAASGFSDKSGGRTVTELVGGLTLRRYGGECTLTSGSIPVVVAVFAGRQDRMSLLMKYLDALIVKGLVHEVHLWNGARTNPNRTWVDGLKDTTHLVFQKTEGWHGAYHFYTKSGQFTPLCEGFNKNDAVFIKSDDDIVYVDTSQFGNFVSYVANNTDMFLVHANTVNNGVAAHYQFQHLPEPVKQQAPVEMEEYPENGLCGKLWKSGSAAVSLLTTFLHHREHFHWDLNEDHKPCLQFQAPSVASPGQGRISINFFGTHMSAMDEVLRLVDGSPGDDEHALTTVATEQGKRECIFTGMNVVHLGFYSQPETATMLPAFARLANGEPVLAEMSSGAVETGGGIFPMRSYRSSRIGWRARVRSHSA